METNGRKLQFTVFTPTYNRAHTLPRLYESLKKQTFKDFEWVIVDDGSVDDTREIVFGWIGESAFPIRYFYQENSGKHVAINRGVEEANGEFFLIVDSDDWLVPDALEKLKRYWDKIPGEVKPYIAGVIGLDQDPSGGLIGTPYPKDELLSDIVEIYYNLGVKGDKSGFYKTAVLREFPFPVFRGEKFIPESIVWNRIAEHYKCLFINEIIAVCDYQPDGLTRRSWVHAMNSPCGMKSSLLQVLTLKRKLPLFAVFRRTVSYARFSFHCGMGIVAQSREVKEKAPHRYLLWFLGWILGFGLYLLDKIKLRKFKKKRCETG